MIAYTIQFIAIGIRQDLRFMNFRFILLKLLNGSIVYEGLTYHNYISLKEDLSPGGFYFVTVTPSSHGQSESFSTVIDFQDVGRSFL